jgi:putative peptidoglycan lipid II flippase
LTALRRATALMTLGTVLSRVTGLIRLAAITAALGVTESHLADAYNLANTAPNIIYELVLGGIITSVFVPVFVELLEKEGRERAWDVASAIINVSLIVLMAIAALGILGAPWIARLYSIGLRGHAAADQREIITFLLRLFIPQIVFYGLAAISSGLLNAHRRFSPPMYTPVLNNIAVIVVFIGFAQAYQRVTTASISTVQLVIIGAGTTAGVVLMAVAQLPFLRGLGRYRPTISIAHPSVKKLAALSVFVIGYVVVNQIGFLIVQLLASGQKGAYTAFISAYTFFMLPHGLFAVSIITALLPGMSQQAVNKRWDLYRAQLSTGIRSTFLLVLPAAIGYFVLAKPIIRLLLQHGVMTSASTVLVATVLQIFVIGLVPFSLFQLFLRAFYAVHDSKTPFLINCAAVGLNTALNFPLFYLYGVNGLAAALVAAYAFGVVIQARALSKRVGGIDARRVAANAARITAAALGMGILVWAIAQAVHAYSNTDELPVQVFDVLVPVGAGVIAYVAFAYALKVEELKLVRGLLGRSFARSEA